MTPSNLPRLTEAYFQTGSLKEAGSEPEKLLYQQKLAANSQFNVHSSFSSWKNLWVTGDFIKFCQNLIQVLVWNAERLLSKKVSSILFEPNNRYKRTIWYIFKVSKKLGYEKEDSWQSTKIEKS